MNIYAPTRTLKAVIVGGLCFSLLLYRAMACGIEWSKPSSHFDNADFQGYAYHVESLETLDLGKGLNLPIYGVFNASNKSVSPYLGQSWELPLLESKLVAIDENTFMLKQPDGWFRMFWRDKKNPTILNGQGNWKAEIKGDTITAWADCGSKLVFVQGRLLQLQIKDRIFNYIYSGGKVVELREGGNTVLKVNTAPDGRVQGLSIGLNKLIGLETSPKPRIQVAAGANLVAGIEQSLSKIISSDGSTRSFTYGVDPSVNPTITLPDGNTLTWNSDGYILSDGQWKYTINKRDGVMLNSIIERTNSLSQKELWDYDGEHCTETFESADGFKTTNRWFASGSLMGKPRDLVVTQHGKVITNRRYLYDEGGVLIRTLENGFSLLPGNFSKNLETILTKTNNQ